MVNEEKIEIAIIEGFENYVIYSNGKVFSKITNKFLKPSKNNKGYLYYKLKTENKFIQKYEHVLVAQAFVKNINKLETVNHKDENKENNDYRNLEWMSRKDNTIYSQSKKVVLKKNGNIVNIFQSMKEASDRCNVSIGSISECCNGKRRYSCGCEWSFGGAE